MGESLFRYQTFWQLFIRPSREAGFRLGHNHLHVAGLENDMVHALVASTNLTLPHLYPARAPLCVSSVAASRCHIARAGTEVGTL